MKEFLFDISKFIIAFLYVFYTVLSYRGTFIKSEEKRRYVYYFQVVMIFTIHIIGYGILFAEYGKIDYILLYMGQVFYFLVIITGYNVAYPKASKLLVDNMCMLLMTGFIIIGRIDSDSCLKQLIFATVGCIITFVVPIILKKMKSVRNYALLYGFLGLLLLTALLFGNKVFGANLVLEIGDFSLQPTEFVKLLYVLFVAAMYNKSTSLKQIFVTSLVAAMHVIVLIISNDLGAALIFFVVYVAMIYVATKKFKFIVAGFLGGGVAAVAAYKMFAHVRVRVLAWLNPWSDIEDKGFQITQSLFALGMGGWFGSGLTQGLPKAIPVVTKDMIFSAIGEEMGMIVAICIILICLNCFILMMNIASMCNTLFYRLLAVGLATCYGFQVFLTIGGAAKFILLTGVTLPFVSYGGSSLISSFFLFALINGMYIMREEELSFERQKDRSGKKKQKK